MNGKRWATLLSPFLSLEKYSVLTQLLRLERWHLKLTHSFVPSKTRKSRKNSVNELSRPPSRWTLVCFRLTVFCFTRQTRDVLARIEGINDRVSSPFLSTLPSLLRGSYSISSRAKTGLDDSSQLENPHLWNPGTSLNLFFPPSPESIYEAF